jgi:hypothetical protein
MLEMFSSFWKIPPRNIFSEKPHKIFNFKETRKNSFFTPNALNFVEMKAKVLMSQNISSKRDEMSRKRYFFCVANHLNKISFHNPS